LEREKGLIKSGEKLERCLCTHAEANAIMQCALFGIGSTTKGSTLYSTYAPCLECSKMVISVGINRVVSLASYPEDGTAILSQARVTMVMLERSDLIPWISYLDGRIRSESK